MNDVRLLQGDCRDVLKTLPDGSVNCCVTSPPYYGLRDYGCDGQIGLEQTPDAYVSELVAVFREVKRVLRDDGTLWLNLGDSYASFRDGKATPDTTRGESIGTLVPKGSAKNRTARTFDGTSVKHKDLIGIPWMVAFALRADGWWLRQDIIWHKPNPMPESVTDRCTKAHEYVFLMSKSATYHCDMASIKEPSAEPDRERGDAIGHNQRTLSDRPIDRTAERCDTRNRRSVWTVNTQPYKGSHFATFPPSLIRPMILAGCPHGGTVLDPFGGSGTTGQVAEEEGRNAILIELNPAYVKLQERRTAQMGLL